MRLTINGQAKDFAKAMTIADLVGQFCKTPKNIISEVNGTIIQSNAWPQTALKDGDTVELVAFVGGG